MCGIKIIEPGMQTLVQDSGRRGYQQYGVPVSGVMDAYAHRISNILAGNEELAAVLEVTFLGPKLEFLSDCVFAVTGGNLQPQINGVHIPMWKSIYAKKGETLSFVGLKSGCRGYIAFSGGITVPEIMGSKSTYMKGRIGGVEGRSLKAGDVLQIGIPCDNLHLLKNKCVAYQQIPVYSTDNVLRVIMGPQAESFTESGVGTFLSSVYSVSHECDRMGYRMEGDVIEHVSGSDIISDGITMGAIQVTGQGKPIIMMADRQTTGGYTKIGTVIRADLWKIAQAKPGDRMRFLKISIDEAHQAVKEQEETLTSIREFIESQVVISENDFDIRVNGESFHVNVEEIKGSFSGK